METKSTVTVDVWKKILEPIDSRRMAIISERAEKAKLLKLPKHITKTAAAIILMGDS